MTPERLGMGAVFAILLGGCAPVENPRSAQDTAVEVDYDTVVPTSRPFEHQARIGSLPDLKRHLQDRWDLARIRSFCSQNRPTAPGMQNLVCDRKFEYGSQLHDECSHDLGVVYWYGCTDDRRAWAYSVNVVNGSNWWWLELGGLTSDTELQDDPDYRMNGAIWAQMWNRVGGKLAGKEDDDCELEEGMERPTTRKVGTKDR